MIKIESVIGLHGVPRSGTSWLAQIFNSHPKVNLKFQPLFSYEFKNYLDEHSTSLEISKFYEEISKSNDAFINMEDPDIHKNYPSFKKLKDADVLVFKHVRYHHILKNILRKDSKLKLILLIRNPLGVLSSWKNAPKEFFPDWTFEEEWLGAPKKNQGKPENYFGYSRWKDAANLFLELSDKYKERVILVKYNDLLSDTTACVKELFSFAGLNLTEQTIQFILESRERNDKNPNSVYKVKVKDESWTQSIPVNIINQIYQELRGSRLEEYLQ